MLPRPSARHPLALTLLVLLICGLMAALTFQPARPFLSNWLAPGQSTTNDAPIAGSFTPQATTGVAALERYNQGSSLQEDVADGRVRFFRRDLPGGGAIAYFVVMLDEQVHIEVVNADGAIPGSDASGDTIWTDGEKHLATVEEIARAPYAARDGMQLLGAMAFGFHGTVRTADEGTVVINGRVHRVNPGRAALCISGARARIGLFDAQQARACEQAIGAGPVILWQGKIANPDVGAATDAFVPFNPLGEDFVLLDWRKKIYTGQYPKSVVGVGAREDGRSYLVLLVSYGVTGVELTAQLKAMGCTEALGGDDDTSTQAVWRGAPIRRSAVQEVPDALAVYTRGATQ
ncbi:MAG: phosphodiester glycosidase family protein [Roseiflexaceae bacterium]